MSNRTDNDDIIIQIYQQENCRFAYTLNDGQPVRCSYIGDQPFFYSDHEVSMEEEDFLFDENLFSFDEIESGLSRIESKLDSLESFVKEIDGSAADRLHVFSEELAFAVAQEKNTSEIKETGPLTDVLSKSRLGAAYLKEAEKHGITLCYTDQTQSAEYNKEEKTILINSSRTKEDQVLLAARELRRMWQHKNGALLHPLTFHPDQSILVNRAQIADRTATMVRIAWELQLAGEKGVWERLENSCYSDLTHAFARESYLDFRTLNNGQASSAVFENWFLSGRCEIEDRILIQQMLTDYQGYVFDSEQASRNITADLIVALGSMPFGKNYLAQHVQTILNDPLFTEVRDRSNANFLWFIKFERSFRESEQELQSPAEPFGCDDRHGLSKKTITRFGDDEKKAEIISLPGKDAPAGIHKTRRVSGTGGANGKCDVVFFEQWTREDE